MGLDSFSQKIKPTGEMIVSSHPGKIVATQKGYLGGRMVEIQIEAAPGSSSRAIKRQMQKAIKSANLIIANPINKTKKTASLHVDKSGHIDQVLKDHSHLERHLDQKSSKNLVDFHLNFGKKVSVSMPALPKPRSYKGFKGLLQKIRDVIFISHTQTNHPHLRNSRIALSAEHISKGAYFYDPVRQVQNLIDTETVNLKLSTNAPTNFFKAHQKYSKATESGEPHIKKNMNRLKAGECLLFSTTMFHHATTAMLVKQSDGKFTFYLSNTGLGLSENHHKYEDAHGVTHFQQVYVVEGVSEQDFRKFITRYERTKDSSVYKGTSPHTVKEAYKDFYRELKILGPSKKVEDPRFWGLGQVGGSCTGGAELAILRIVLTKKSFKDFKTKLSTHSAFKMYRKLVQKKDKSYPNKIAILEIVQKLQRKQLNQELKTTLDFIKSDTEKQIDKSRELTLPHNLNEQIYKSYAKTPVDTPKPADKLKLVCFSLANGNYQAAQKFIDELRKLPKDASRKETDEVVKTLIRFYSTDKQRTREMLSLYYQLSNVFEERGIASDKKWVQNWKKVARRDYFKAKVYKYFPSS